jgi:hypothetical protein
LVTECDDEISPKELFAGLQVRLHIMSDFQAGAGGNWEILDELPDPNVVRQASGDSCLAACAEMLLRDMGRSLDQSIIFRESQVFPGEYGRDVVWVTRVLNQLAPISGRRWIGGFCEIPGADSDLLVRAMSPSCPWIAEFRQPYASMGHAVIVDSVKREILDIRDPWVNPSNNLASRYRMSMAGFVEVWTLRAIYLS